MSKWTPGKWWVGYSESGAVVAVVNESGDRYFVAHINEGYPNAEQSEANARLIAAAPEMAELLDDACAALEMGEAETRSYVALQIRALLARIDQ